MRNRMLAILFGLLVMLPEVLGCVSPSIGGGCRRRQETQQNSDHLLKGVLGTDHNCYELGEPVKITFTVTNTSDHALTLHKPNESVISLQLVEGGGRTYSWDPSSGMEEPLSYLVLEAGQSYIIEWSVIPAASQGVNILAKVWLEKSYHLDMSLSIAGPF
ncbi:MAG TPA: hypothetical protein VJJ70_06650 [Anaerolineales bacterium]|nr:hypothetical protein [Anaerolineales bacterium]